jgi:hypothetical protein
LPSGAEPLACPRCGSEHEAGERFCPRCGMPLVRRGGGALERPLSDAHGRARKIDPRYTTGDLVRVAGGGNQAEAELIQGLLLEEGVPSVLQRSAGFDVPDFLAAGPRDVLVPAAGAEAARDVLREAALGPPPAGGPAPPAARARVADARERALRLAALVAGGGGLTALVAWLLVRAAK